MTQFSIQRPKGSTRNGDELGKGALFITISLGVEAATWLRRRRERELWTEPRGGKA